MQPFEKLAVAALRIEEVLREKAADMGISRAISTPSARSLASSSTGTAASICRCTRSPGVDVNPYELTVMPGLDRHDLGSDITAKRV